jgi:hypothetical protein
MRLHLLTVVLVAALVGCDGSGPRALPTSPTSPAAAAAGAGTAVTRLTLHGNAALTVIGQMTPITAIASLSDGGTRNVTTAAQWASSNTSNLAVSPGGMVTVMRFGQSHVSATYQGKSATLNVQATPPGTFVAWGRARDAGDGGLAGVTVREDSSGISTLSNPDGEFSFGGLTGTRLTFDKDGYERAALEMKPGIYSEAPMQRVIRIAAGGRVDVDLAPHDASYEVAAGVRCYPCRLIRVANAPAGRLQLRASWIEPRAALTLWINGRRFEGTAPSGPLEVVADVAIDAPGELLVYVGIRNAADYHAPFTLATEVVNNDYRWAYTPPFGG